MSHLRSARLFVVTMVAVTLAACSGQSPVAPDQLSSAKGGGTGGKPSTGVTGVYALTFHAPSGRTYEEVSSLPVYSPGGVLPPELRLKAQVTDASGNAATTGTVTFDYCSYGKPTDDITNPDEAPKEACEQGTATWVQLRRAVRVSDATCFYLGGGSACTYFGVVRIPRSVGFRFRYVQQGSSIASGTSPGRNFLWVAP